MEIVSGLDEIRARYSEQFVVESGYKLADGQPMAYKVRPLKPIGMMAAGLSWPMISGSTSNGESAQADPEFWKSVRLVCARSVVAARQVGKEKDGSLVSVWTPVEVICNREPNPKAKVQEVSIDDLDYSDTISRIWGELLQRFQLHSGNEGDGGRPDPGHGVREPGNGSEDVRKDAARNRVRGKRLPDLQDKASE